MEPIITVYEHIPTLLELFGKFFDEDLVQIITQHSNKYAAKQNATA